MNPIDVAVGQHLIDVPGVTATAGANYVHRVGADTTLVALVNYSYTGHSNGSYLLTDSNYYNPSYSVVNASVGLRFSPHQLTVYARTCSTIAPSSSGPRSTPWSEGYTVHPRTVGVTLKIVE
jgi:hypothetical protein